MMNNDKSTKIKLRVKFLEYHHRITKAVIKHPEFKFGKNNHNLLSIEAKEAQKIHNFICKIDDLISDLEKTYTFIKRFPIKEYYEKNNINQLDFIKYHFEVFIHKIHTILEVKKLWLNEFYKVGLKEKDCNWNKLKNNEKVHKSPAKIIVNNYFKSFENIITFRHLNTHQAFFKETKYDNLKSDLTTYIISKQYGIKIDNHSKKHIFLEIKRYRKEKLNYIKNGIEIAEIYSLDFIYIMLIEFFTKKIET